MKKKRSIKQTKQPTLPIETEPCRKSAHIESQKTDNNTLTDATENPAILTVPDETDLPDTTDVVLPDATKDMAAPPDETDGVDDNTPPTNPKPGKSGRGVFKSKTITIHRSKDPHTFKCSVCGN